MVVCVSAIISAIIRASRMGLDHKKCAKLPVDDSFVISVGHVIQSGLLNVFCVVYSDTGVFVMM